MPSFQPLASAQKRKLEDDDSESPNRKRVSLGTMPVSGPSTSNHFQDQIWMVQWRNHQYKKHKTWDGDGVLVVSPNSQALLYDSDGTMMGTDKVAKAFPLVEGRNVSFGSKDVELEREIPRAQFLSGACFGHHKVDIGVISTKPHTVQNKFNPPSFQRPAQTTSVKGVGGDHSTPALTTDPIGERNILLEELFIFITYSMQRRKPQDKKNKTWDGDAYVSLINEKLIMISEDGKIMGTTPWKGNKEVELDAPVSISQLPETKGVEQLKLVPDPMQQPSDMPNTPEIKQKPFIPPASFYAKQSPKVKTKRPLHVHFFVHILDSYSSYSHDPHAPDALVMKAPTKEHMKIFNKRNLSVVPVVVDPILSRKMRPHQKQGVSFLYECVMGLRKHEGQGCILADEMGLGKTLQTISLVWTLLRQNPYAAPLPTVQKVLVVCPVSLINNWKAEFHKWLGRDRVGILTCDKNNNAIDLFGRSKVYEVLIIGYERLRTTIPPIGLIICDEGHRLKSANNKTAGMFKALGTRRRVILSGTPIQNDLGEFHAMAEFCNPGLLDDYSVFRKVYEMPILKSRAPDASRKKLNFVLRRDTSLLKNHLPPKTEFVVFVTPTALQLEMFSKILNPSKLDDLIQKSNADSLALTTILRKISNSPILLKATADRKLLVLSKMLRILRQVCDMFSPDVTLMTFYLLEHIRKMVLVSHFTSTLNILEAFCKKMSYSYFRLDGQTPQTKRQEYVDAFNKGNQHNGFIFLLSSKAGGVGINLIGGSRLFLIDPDWNPSHDLQSMARCHRDGQKRPVYIYRLLTAGAIDEKIYQRQVTKLALSEYLRDIFRIHPDTACNTHDLLECGCDEDTVMEEEPETLIEEIESENEEEEESPKKMGFVCASDYLQKKKAELASLSEWKHINCLKPSATDLVQDDVLRRIIETSVDKDDTSAGLKIKTDRSRLAVLLAETDINAILTTTTRDFPGGTVSFLFEKYSKTSLEESIDE
ncbi:RAD54B protein [Pholiota molesta]|nr:RAD54B protein [Pholiota molesta]